MSRQFDYSTVCIRGGQGPDPFSGAIVPPICQSTTFVQAGVGQEQVHTYSRQSNPTVSALESRLGVLEDALPACCFSSGMAATATLCFALCRAGDRIVASDVVYGGTWRLLREVLAPLGVTCEFVDSADPDRLRTALQQPTRILLLESPANPTLKLSDLQRCAELGHAAGTVVVVDNTFLTPVLQRPLDLGADVALYSTTKYLDGHNATVGGAVCSRDAELLERLRYLRTTLGTIQTPFEAWLTLQGMKTLPLRMARHSDNALFVARHLQQLPTVRAVNYPGLTSFPQHELACRQQRRGGGLVTFELPGGLAAAVKMTRALRLCSLAENLGSAETLVTHPATMTHHSIPQAEREALGIGDGLVRLSVGLEDPEDIFADLSQAIAAATSPLREVTT
ncbi:MAG: aminotransferase class I/II-fold pyridoxal phosphate-dependent enzyme [bacterium]